MNTLGFESIKPNYLRHPAWRWAVAMSCMVDGSDPKEIMRVASLSDDTWLLEACTFFRYREDIIHSTMSFRSKHPAMFEAFLIHNDSKTTGGFKWLLEAYLMTNATDEMIAEEVGTLHGARTIELYRKVYFDIDHYRSKPSSVLCNVLATSLSMHHEQSEVDFTWKSFAYTMGFEAMKNLVRFKTGGTLSPEYATYFRTVTGDRRIYNAYHATGDIRARHVESALLLVDSADKHYNMSKLKDGLEEDGKVGELVAKEMLSALEKAFLDTSLEARIDNDVGVSERCMGTDNFRPDLALEQRVLPAASREN